MQELLPNQLEDVVDFIKVTISRIRRRERKKGASQRRGGRGRGGARGEERGSRVRGGGGGAGGGRGQGCMLKQIHLNVSDLGLGYQSSEEMIFRYCSGPCRKSETNYDKILYSLAHSRKLLPKDTPPHACCRPIAFDDDLSFLDDNLIYHTVRKHSARKCGCV
ncbi:glial cell line-derived neurotrophic factor [Myripristis murdjan]|uniref:glial cell line-derived neurotrophic factor n=1 Tax=Myripristis murdjan TaxID=586833 RepID=UPI001175EC67|nr:glial cell line-derived neurotrophic factor-like [Myripristis murdjan]